MSEFESFRAELRALTNAVSAVQYKTIRDQALRERFRMLFRTWTATVEPSLRIYQNGKKEILKLAAEIEKLARLASKQKRVIEYRKYLRRASEFSDNLVIQVPTAYTNRSVQPSLKQELFISRIPDLPLSLVPNPIIGWRSQIETFMEGHPFDKSVFIMVRYRERNTRLVAVIKNALAREGLFGLLAAEHKLTDDLYNPVACLLCCARGIAVFDKPEPRETFNPNVAYELGMLHLLNRRCLILKHSSLSTLQTDILMKVYTPYKRVTEVEKIVKTWGREGN